MSELSARLREAMDDLGLEKPIDLANFCGVSEGLVSQWFSGRTKLGPKPLKAFSRKSNISLDWLTDGRLPKHRKIGFDSGEFLDGAMAVRAADKDDPEFIQIPMVELRLAAGVTGFQTEPDRRDGGTLGMRRSWIERNHYDPCKLIAIQVKGESMEPGLHEGDVVVINTADTKPIDGVVYAVNYEGEAVIKRMSRDAGMWWLTSDNPDQRKYHRKSVQGNETIIIGRVVRKESDKI